MTEKTEDKFYTISIHPEYQEMWSEWKHQHEKTNKSRYILELIKSDMNRKETQNA